MKHGHLFKSLLTVALFSAGTFAHGANPENPQGKKDEAPKQKIITWCEERGLYEKTKDPDGNELFICRLVANDFCWAYPCWVGMPIGNRPVFTTPVPPNIQIEEGQSFFAYKENDALKVVLTDKINGQLSEENGMQKISVIIGK